MLRLMRRTGALNDHRPHTEVANDRPEHRALIRRAGAEGTVLLKNSGILPLDKTKRPDNCASSAPTPRWPRSWAAGRRSSTRIIASAHGTV